MTTTSVRTGGKHAETGALGNLLARLGVTAPHTGEPFGEAMLLGLGGGLGGGYWTFEFGQNPMLVIGARHSWENSHKFLTAACERLSAPARFEETGSAKAADRQLRRALADGRTALAWVDLASLPYYGMASEWEKCYVHVVGVRGPDEAGELEIDDRAPVPWTITAAELARARAAITSNKHRLMLVDAPTSEVDLPRAIQEGVRACHRGLTEPPIKNFGLPAFGKWADLVANPKDKKGWPKVFPPGRYLYRALSATFHGIETSGTGGGAFRPMYADFLDEAADPAAKPGLREAAAHYRELGRLWNALAAAALPDSAAPLALTRELLLQKNRLFEDQGAPALVEIRETDQQLQAIEAAVGDAFPLSQADVDDLLLDLQARLRQIDAAEWRAAEALGAAVGRDAHS